MLTFLKDCFVFRGKKKLNNCNRHHLLFCFALLKWLLTSFEEKERKKKSVVFYSEVFDAHSVVTMCCSDLERIVQLTLEPYKVSFFLTKPRNASSRIWGTTGSNQGGLAVFESFCECLKRATLLSRVPKCLGQVDTSGFNESMATYMKNWALSLDLLRESYHP